MTERYFRIWHIRVCSGIAVLLLLFHHLFYIEDRYKRASFLLYKEDGVPYAARLAPDARVGAAILMVLAGIALYMYIEERMAKDSAKCSVSDLYEEISPVVKRLMISFWIVFAVFAACFLLVDKTGTAIYGKNFARNLMADVLGMSGLLDTPSMSEAWKYLSALLAGCLSAPFVWLLLEKLRLVTVAAVVFAIAAGGKADAADGIWQCLYYSAFFAGGMCLARYRIMDRVLFAVREKKAFVCVPLTFVILAAGLYIRHKLGPVFDTVFAPIVIVCVSVLAVQWQKPANCFAFAGRYAAVMVVFYTFFYTQPLAAAVLYRLKYAAFVFAALVGLSLAGGILIEWIKKRAGVLLSGWKEQLWPDAVPAANRFQVKQTSCMKGIAIIYLMMKHLFDGAGKDNYYRALVYLPWNKGESLISAVSAQGRVVVSIFLILSSYGLCYSYAKAVRESAAQGKTTWPGRLSVDLRFVLARLRKLYGTYWLVFAVFGIYGNVTGLRTFKFVYNSPWQFVCDLLGISYLFYGYDHSYNITWWFMSIIIVYYVLFPVLYRWIRRMPFLSVTILLGVSILVNYPPRVELVVYSFAFVLGIYLHQKDALNRWIACKSRAAVFGLAGVLLLLSVALKVRYDILADNIFGLSILLLAAPLVISTSWVNRILCLLGMTSSYIFYFHTFLYAYWYKDLVYAPKYPLLILLVFLAVCAAIGWLLLKIEQLMRKKRYIRVLYWALFAVLLYMGSSYSIKLIKRYIIYYEPETAIRMEIYNIETKVNGNKTITVSWDKIKSDLEGYRIYRKVGTDSFECIGETDANRFVDESPVPGIYNFYKVIPYYMDENGEPVFDMSAHPEYIYGIIK